MRLLILSFYFPPDLSAGSFRARALVDELSRQLGPHDRIHVLTSEPNRYESFDAAAPRDERSGNVAVSRFPVPGHRSGMLGQGWSYRSYVSSVLRDVWDKGEMYDLIFATSSRLMTGALGAVVARRTDAPLYLDLRDLFPINLSEVFGGRPQKSIVPLLGLLERWTVSSASRVSVVSPGFLSHLRKIRDDLDYQVFTNGIDEEFLDVDYRTELEPLEGPTIVLYAGNIGEGQGLEHVVPEAAAALAPEFEFWIVGDGGRRRQLERRLGAVEASNVRVFDPVPRQDLLDLYRGADVLFLHLNDYDAFRRVLPSKLFEYAATGKPVLAGVEGVSRDFIQKQVTNAAVFAPCDVTGLIRALDELQMETRPRTDFVKRFRRSAITSDMAADILDLAESEVAAASSITQDEKARDDP